jgi:aspartate aminotransferase
MKLSSRAARIGESATLLVSRLAAELRAKGVDVVSLGAGEPDFDSSPAAVEAAITALRDGFTRYTMTTGIPELRAALADGYARRHGAPWTAEQVVVTVGAKAALFELALAVFGRGDEVVVPSPYWVSTPEQIRFCGATPVLVETSAADQFRVRADAVLARLSGSTRAVLVNTPCNPTGSVIEPEDLAAIAAGCAARGVLLICDETYDRFVYDGFEFASAAAHAAEFPETVVVVGSFSKTYAMTGWRVGFVVGPSEVMRAVARIQSHATSNPTSFAMKGALAALEGSDAEVDAVMREYEQRRDLVMEHLGAMRGVDCLPPRGAFYAFPDVSAHYDATRPDSVAFARALLAEAAVAVVPGVAFGADRHVRLSFACSRQNLVEGLRRLGAFLDGARGSARGG